MECTAYTVPGAFFWALSLGIGFAIVTVCVCGAFAVACWLHDRLNRKRA